MDRNDVAGWLSAYVDAWKTYDEVRIGELFTDDATYRYHPNDEPLRGREAIVESWLSDRDAEGTYDADYRPLAVDDEVAVATGSSTYVTEPGGPLDKIYDNCFVMRFDAEARCSDFTEWFMKRPDA